ncbi:MAG: hypothetical protein B0D96_13255 [Candidatus Sedimenticola endophacoides]|uniref:Uncharacterized protein n=1 Tax=Candidatus Sedimenticola endophacoides TaxID=2548426 RepID=A0A657PM52_9GAMM|nr:MAG: hypothetical protein B0D96_13255 [Candidatus Sedimenticola endophacoides]OQX32799.1 MAG: hypothetical protein B0D94_00090 [Candidatus Sedimenticola endophacoides]OQX33264.1 MAG: hypothetical protein B0D84_04870 [Candidatus Sedimenticola endophacoides]OQX44045.1 MAG: hypothetical protein B0D88_03285 [Candidatus Sedimenticola endophacoides]OQX46828.1 MAG: hypothetical protein B0D90_00535 [Candidatus Sedimenticola endophacoides]
MQEAIEAQRKMAEQFAPTARPHPFARPRASREELMAERNERIKELEERRAEVMKQIEERRAHRNI